MPTTLGITNVSSGAVVAFAFVCFFQIIFVPDFLQMKLVEPRLNIAPAGEQESPSFIGVLAVDARGSEKISVKANSNKIRFL